MGNYGDNPLEWFPQFNVGFSATHRNHLDHLLATLPARVAALKKDVQANPASATARQALADAEITLQKTKERRDRFTQENFDRLSPRARALFEKALSTNSQDPDYRKLTPLRYQDGNVTREVNIPRGDVLHQFRQDVATGKLPFVSWIVAPENLSDHPSSAWYGAWYVSEVMNILTQNPDVWRKTIFLLTYDENDGYFDHVPPFAAPHPRRPETGIAGGIRTDEDFVTKEEELQTKPAGEVRESSIGLGFRVPLVIASPWSRGGFVCSQVFDHTSSLQFLEKLLSKKLGQSIQEPNISAWRRTVCGDLTACFRPYLGEKIPLPAFLQKAPFVESIHKAQYRPIPVGPKALTPAEIKSAMARTTLRQEPGTRPSCALPYELAADGAMNPVTKCFELTLAAKNSRFGARSAGGAFNVYAPRGHKALENHGGFERCRSWNFAVPAGESLKYCWQPGDFEDGIVLLRVYGPNGFFREFRNDGDATVQLRCEYRAGHQVALTVANSGPACVLNITHNAYSHPPQSRTIPTSAEHTFIVDGSASLGWHDFTVQVAGRSHFAARFAGRVETGIDSISDPQIGRS